MKKAIATQPGELTRYEDLTADNVIMRNREEQQVDEEKPFNDWLYQMAQSDQKMPRILEDVIDAVGEINFDAFLIAKYNEKKTLRALKPTEAE